MKLIKEIYDEKFPNNDCGLKIREASRIIAMDEDGLMPILFVSNKNYHKIPGGGIDAGEDKVKALAREVIEETGCTIEISGEVGQIIEYRSAINFNWNWNMKQTSYCYWGKIVSKDNNLKFTEEEIDEGYKLLWVPLDAAIKLVEDDKPSSFEGAFIQKRELAILKQFKKIQEL